MKSSVKKFLSALCIVTSVSGVVAPTLVGATDCTGSASSHISRVDTTLNDFCDLIYERNYQRWYDGVMDLRRRGIINDLSALMLITLNQTICFGALCGIDDIKNMVVSGDWSLIIDELKFKAQNDALFPHICIPGDSLDLSGNAFSVFDSVVSGTSITQALIMLNPANVIS